MEYNGDFKYDLLVGQKGEKIVDDIFKNKKIEVKRDSWVGKTGNIAIEYMSRGKLSGIATTQADYWAFVLSGSFADKVILMFETERLKDIAREYGRKGYRKDMGDNNTSKSVLIPIKELCNFAYND